MSEEHKSYSWSDSAGEGYVQTIKDGKVIRVNSLPIQEAKDMYYKTRSKEMQAYDKGREKAAADELRRMDALR